MIPLPAPHRTRRRREPVVVVGILLVLALVAILPIALALVHADGFCDEAGVGTGLGDVTAAALSSLQRDLNSSHAHRDALPSHTERVVPAFLAAPPSLAGAVDAPGLFSEHPSRDGSSTSPPAAMRVCRGPGPDGTPLLL